MRSSWLIQSFMILHEIQKSEDSVVHSEKQEDAKHDARGTFGLINDKKAAG